MSSDEGFTAEDAERQVLGAMLSSRWAVDEVSAVITDGDYYSPRHGDIHAAIVELAAGGHPHDMIATADHLQKAGSLQRVGGTAYLHQLVSGLVVAANVGWHAGIVREASMRRRLHAEAAALQQIPVDTPAAEAVNEAIRRLSQVSAGATVELSHEDAVDEALASLNSKPGMPTPWGDLTDVMGGWYPGELIVVAARPGIGKTAVAIEAALACAKSGKRAVVISLEMMRSELYLRMLSNLSGVDGSRIRHRDLRDVDHDALQDAAAKIKELPLSVTDQSNMSISQVVAYVRKQQREHGDVGLVIVDYISKVAAPRELAKQNRSVQVDAIASGLKNLAKDLRVPVMALAQLNRGIEQRSDKRPMLSDLRESGGIEAEADAALLMHRARDEQEGDPTKLEVLVRKNRHGPEADVELTFVGHRSRIAGRAGY